MNEICLSIIKFGSHSCRDRIGHLQVLLRMRIIDDEVIALKNIKCAEWIVAVILLYQKSSRAISASVDQSLSATGSAAPAAPAS